MWIQNASQSIEFGMVTTAGAADAAATVAARRILDGIGPTSCVGNVINRGAGLYSLTADSTDMNAKTVGLYFTATGDVPLTYAIRTIPGVPLIAGSNAGQVAIGSLVIGSNINVGGVIQAGIIGNITGSLSGSVGSVTGNLGGNVLGSVQGNIGGSLAGNVLGSVQGNIGGNLAGSVGSMTGSVGGSVGSVTGNVGGNVVGSVGSVAGAVGGNVNGDVLGSVRGNVGGSVLLNLVGNVNGSVGSIAAGGIGLTSFTAAALNGIADAILDRNMATGTDSGTDTVRTVRQALRVSRNKVDSITGIVYKEDNATTSFTFTVTTAAGNPITIFTPTP